MTMTARWLNADCETLRTWGSDYANAVNYGSDKLRFVGPVPAGAKVHSHSRMTAVEAGPKGTRVESEIAVHVVGSERPSVIYTMITLYQGARS